MRTIIEEYLSFLTAAKNDCEAEEVIFLPLTLHRQYHQKIGT